MNMPFYQAIKQVQKAKEKTIEDKAWDMWLSFYPDMTIPKNRYQENNKVYQKPYIEFINFTDFLEKVKKPKLSQRTAEEILAEAEEIKMKVNKRKQQGKGV